MAFVLGAPLYWSIPTNETQNSWFEATSNFKAFENESVEHCARLPRSRQTYPGQGMLTLFTNLEAYLGPNQKPLMETWYKNS